MTDRLEEIKQRLEAATPGPWEATPGEPDVRTMNGDPEWLVVFPSGEDASLVGEADAALIANAPDDLAYLIGEVERLREGIASAEMLARSCRAEVEDGCYCEQIPAGDDDACGVCQNGAYAGAWRARYGGAGDE